MLLTEEETTATKSEKIYIGKPIEINAERLLYKLNWLRERCDDVEIIHQMLCDLVPNYQHRPAKRHQAEALRVERPDFDANAGFDSDYKTVNL